MKRLLPPLLLTAVAFGPGCSGGESLSSQQDVYAAAVSEADGDADLNGVPGDEAAPTSLDMRPGPQERALHFDCELPAVEARVQERTHGADGAHARPEGVGRPPREGDGEMGPPPRGEGDGEMGPPPRGRGGPLNFRRLLTIYDSDDDGDLSEAERADLEADLAVRCANLQASLLADFDADGDGALSETELEAARAAREAAHEAREAQALADFDADGDGALSHDERRAAHEARRAELQAAYDADGSGDLDATEQAALRAHLRQVVRGEVTPA